MLGFVISQDLLILSLVTAPIIIIHIHKAKHFNKALIIFIQCDMSLYLGVT